MRDGWCFAVSGKRKEYIEKLLWRSLRSSIRVKGKDLPMVLPFHIHFLFPSSFFTFL